MKGQRSLTEAPTLQKSSQSVSQQSYSDVSHRWDDDNNLKGQRSLVEAPALQKSSQSVSQPSYRDVGHRWDDM